MMLRLDQPIQVVWLRRRAVKNQTEPLSGLRVESELIAEHVSVLVSGTRKRRSGSHSEAAAGHGGSRLQCCDHKQAGCGTQVGCVSPRRFWALEFSLLIHHDCCVTSQTILLIATPRRVATLCRDRRAVLRHLPPSHFCCAVVYDRQARRYSAQPETAATGESFELLPVLGFGGYE
jgi:hypothetical protein